MLQAAEAAWKQRDYQRSISILEQASRSLPDNPQLLLQLARCHGLCHNYAAAEKYFERIVKVTREKNETFMAAGLHFLNFGQFETAGHYFERALKQNGDSIEIFARLAEIRERQNRLDEAADLIERALSLNADFIPAQLIQARLHRLSGQLDKAEMLLRSLVNKPNPDSELRARAWYELGAVLDKLSRFDAAMTAFLEAKACVIPTDAQKAARLAARNELGKTAGAISSAMLRRWQAAGEKFKPRHKLAILCGHPRSGTTLLEQVLDAHPGIVSAEETNIFYEEAFVPLGRGAAADAHFIPVLDSIAPSLLRQSRTNYFRCMERFLAQSIGNRWLIDKNPSLISLIPAIIRIFPETRFLVALRDPRDVCLSCFMQPLFPTQRISATYPTLETTVTDYSLTMGLWQTLKPIMPNPFLEVRYEDLVENLEAVARRTLEFLEAPWDDRVLQFQKHAQNKIVRSPTYSDVRQPVTKRAVGRWRNYQKYLEPYLPTLEPLVKAFGYE